MKLLAGLPLLTPHKSLVHTIYDDTFLIEMFQKYFVKIFCFHTNVVKINKISCKSPVYKLYARYLKIQCKVFLSRDLATNLCLSEQKMYILPDINCNWLILHLFITMDQRNRITQMIVFLLILGYTIAFLLMDLRYFLCRQNCICSCLQLSQSKSKSESKVQVKSPSQVQV